MALFHTHTQRPMIKVIIICLIQHFDFWGRLSMESPPQNPELRNNPET